MFLPSLLLVVCFGLLVAMSRGQDGAEAGPQRGPPGGGRGTSQLHPRSDVTGNDLDCGQLRGQPCLVCADVNTVTNKCLANSKCRAFVYNGTCGALKLAPQPRVKHTSYTVFIVSSANQTANNGTNASSGQGASVLEAAQSSTRSGSSNGAGSSSGSNGASTSSNTPSIDNNNASSSAQPQASRAEDTQGETANRQ